MPGPLTSNLAERLSRGETRSQEELYEALQPITQRRRRTYYREGWNDERDIHHSVFVDTMCAVRRLKNKNALPTLAVLIAQRRLMKYTKLAKRARLTYADPEKGDRAPDGRPSPEDLAIAKQHREILARAIEALPEHVRKTMPGCSPEAPERFRDIMRLYSAGVRDEEVRAKLNLTEGQLRNDKNRARKMVVEIAKEMINRG